MHKAFVFSLVLVLNSCFYARADWGAKGHRVIAEIAEAHLSKKAEKQIANLLDEHSLAFVSNYADEIKSDSSYDQYKPWHYINFSMDTDYQGKKTSEKGDIAEGIQYCISQIKNTQLPKEKRAFFLKMLVHLIGDLHQPMHVGIEEDRGGNRFTVKWFGRKTNLHRVWDSQMINGYGMSYSEMARNRDRLGKAQLKEMQKGSVQDWINDSRKLTRDIYSNTQEDASLSYQYSYRYMDSVRDQLHKGGVRLASLLNKIFR